MVGSRPLSTAARNTPGRSFHFTLRRKGWMAGLDDCAAAVSGAGQPRHVRADPELALRGTNAKFERRFAYIERALSAQGRAPAQASLAEMDALWNEAKAEEAR